MLFPVTIDAIASSSLADSIICFKIEKSSFNVAESLTFRIFVIRDGIVIAAITPIIPSVIRTSASVKAFFIYSPLSQLLSNY